ncbi:unnamed protein product [Prunus armeniaca]|uniref:Uncharacterized protein n=1 Tax=Prunus armeniaca TaxID=36596 RepID=A0A6J5U2M2_PRUAR|nr:unnamed protein product [Prunus armeniaca]CAB4301019.1 unnamed protein product [Prunus armeniaca]
MEAEQSPKKPQKPETRIPPPRGQVKAKIFRDLWSKVKAAAESVVTGLGGCCGS